MTPRELGLIWARSGGRTPLIGRSGGIPWRVPADQRRFRRLTSGAAVIMGRATWDSLPPRFRPLPDRQNIVLTHNRAWTATGAQAATSVDAALTLAGDRTVWGIGGGAVYAALLPRATHLEVTEVDLDLGPLCPGDTVAPTIPAGWTDVATSPWQRPDEGPAHRFRTYRRTTSE